MRQSDAPLLLSPVQQAWMQELGVEAALLRHYAAPLNVKPQRVVAPDPAPDPARVRRSAEPIRARQDLMQNVPRAQRLSLPPTTSLAQAAQPARRSAQLLCQVYAPQADGGGSASAWVVVGEAPLRAPTALAQGRAAQLLNAMLAAVHLQPKGAVLPLGESVMPCGCILALGRAAAAALLDTDCALESLRGKVWSHLDAAGQAIPVVATYPPGWLLTHPGDKAGVWRDLLLAQDAARG